MSSKAWHPGIALVSFDIDGTLTPGNSWLALTQALGASQDRHLWIYDQYSNGQIDYPSAKRDLLALWVSTGLATRQYFSQILRSLPLRAEAYETVDWVKRQGYEVCLISGSMDLYVSLVAERLNVSDFYANSTLIFDHEDRLVDLEYFLDQAQKKVEQLTAFCEKRGIRPEQVVAVGNSDNDGGLFDLTNHGLLIEDKPSLQLRQRSWKVINNLSDIKDVLTCDLGNSIAHHGGIQRETPQFC